MHLVLVDGSSFIFRAFHALPQLTRKTDGLPVGSVIGFCNMIWKLTEDLSGDDTPTHMAVIFDYSSKTFRDEIYAEYKQHRPPAPEIATRCCDLKRGTWSLAGSKTTALT